MDRSERQEGTMNGRDAHEGYRTRRYAVWFALLSSLLHFSAVGAAGASPYQFPMSKAAPAERATKPSGPNPMLAFLPAGAQPDLEAWRNWMTQKSQEKRATLPAIDPTKLILAGESEPNGTQATANSITGFGTGGGEDAAADVSGAIAPPVAPSVIGPFPEDDGSIALASSTGLVSGSAVKTSQYLGDGPYGSAGTGSGDFDFFVITGVAAGDTITVDIDAQVLGSPLDPFVALWDAAGIMLAFNDDFVTYDSFLTYTATAPGTYYVSVGAYLSPFPTNPFDSSSGPGSASEGSYDVTLGLNSQDTDYFSISLDPGDVIAGAVTGGATELRLYDPSTAQRIGSQQDAGIIIPGPFPTGNAAFAYVAEVGGTYAVRVGGGSGAYTLQLRAFRPFLEGQPLGTVQTLFIDFNGAAVNPAIFGGSPGSATLSPLSSFLAGWGLTPADENAVIDAILAAVEENLSSDMRVLGLNGDFDVTATAGDFDVVILNSRDHPDPFGNPNVSRVIIGGTIPELGIATIGIAESIDVVNFAPGETAVVLLGLLSAPSSDPNSLNQFGLAGGATIFDLIGAGVGNIASHEAGHFFANFHTDNFDAAPNIMDQGGNLANTVGVGPDLTLGTSDDADVDFGPDVYVPNEGYTGMEDTLNAVAFDLSTTTVGTGCGDGVINGVGEQCDDGNLLDGDCCSATCTMPTCTGTGFGKASLLAKDEAGKEKMLVKFIKGPALGQPDFGNPVGGSTAYRLCVWRDGPTLVADYEVDRAGDTCGSSPCWSVLGAAPPNGSGYRYKDTLATSDGIGFMSLKGGAAGKSKLLIKGKGAALPPLTAALQSATSVTLQLHGDDAPQCLETTLTTISKQLPTQFKAKK
jgi:cysteine-rich repeat protein